jgi:isopentenyl phosphate kinase
MVKVDSYMQSCIRTSNTLVYQKTRITAVNMYIHAVCQIVMPILYRDVLYASTIVVTLVSMDMVVIWIILKDSNNSNLLNFYVRK